MIPTVTRSCRFLALLCCVLAPPAAAQDVPIFTEDFPAGEFQARRELVMDAVGPGAVALLQGAPSPLGYVRFRQTNSFYYLTGVETPHAYLLLNGATRRSSLYLPPRDVRRESSEGRLLTSDDAELAIRKTGVDDVHPSWKLSDHLARLAWSANPPVVHTPLAPAELAAMSRDLATRGNSDIANDPWDARPSREATFVSRLEGRFPRLEIRDLTPVLDRARLVKSEHEIALIAKATRLSGLALMEAMRSTSPGIHEHELDAVGKFLFFRDGAQSEAYYSLVATGTNAWYPHYHRGASRLEDGDLILMDYAPDVGYYTSDVTRMWPVNGVFNEWQRDLYGFYLACYRAILDAIRPGDIATVMGEAATRMEEIVRDWPFTKPHYRPAAEAFVASYRRRAAGRPNGMGHGVGMAVHDVGNADGTLTPGMVFTIEPQFRVPEDRIYIRLEDVIVITEDGAENISDFVPMDIEDIEALMAEEGLLDRYPSPLQANPGR
jgi:Xaa-Pro aminopeptidase